MNQLLISIPLVAALTAGGVALAGGGESPPTAGGSTDYVIEGAGTVTLKAGGVAIESIDPATGWTATVDAQSSTEVEIDFDSTSESIRFEAELEDGTVKTELEFRSRTEMDDEADEPDEEDELDEVGGEEDSTEDDEGSDGNEVRTEAFLTAVTGIQAVEIPGLGTVTVNVNSDSLALVSVSAAEGWNYSLDDQEEGEVELDFTGDAGEVDVNLELEDGLIRLRTIADD